MSHFLIPLTLPFVFSRKKHKPINRLSYSQAKVMNLPMLNWLPVRLKFKRSNYMCKTFNTHQPPYLAACLNQYTMSYNNTNRECLHRNTILVTYGPYAESKQRLVYNYSKNNHRINS